MNKFEFIPQCKGKLIWKVAPSKLDKESIYECSIKYDGNYAQIHINEDGEVQFFTSSGKPFRLSNFYSLPEQYKNNHKHYLILEAEYIANTDGKMGSRGKCTTTTYRTSSAKGNNVDGSGVFMVFNAIVKANNKLFNNKLTEPIQSIDGNVILKPVVTEYLHFKEIEQKALELIRQGYEGLMARASTFKYKPGKRVNNLIKFKEYKIATLKCIEVLEGEGKYANMIGSLKLVDASGIEVQVGSGLTDNDRLKDTNYFIDKTIIIKYESFKDTYIQPVYIGIKE